MIMVAGATPLMRTYILFACRRGRVWSHVDDNDDESFTLTSR